MLIFVDRFTATAHILGGIMKIGDRVKLYGGRSQGTVLDEGIFATIEDERSAPWNVSANCYIGKLDMPCSLHGVNGDYVVLQLRYGAWDETGELNMHLVDGPLGEKWTLETLGDITEANVNFSIA